MLKDLGAVASRLGRTPSYNDLIEANRRKECASPNTYERQFGSIRHAQRLAGLVPNVYPPEVLRTEQRLISELQNIARTLGRTPGVSDMREYQIKRLCSPVKAFISHFGSLRAAQEAAGLTPNIPGYELRKSKEVLIKDLQLLSKKLGHTPRMKDINVACKRGEISASAVYVRVFGSLVKAQREAGLIANVSNRERSKTDEQIFSYLRAFTHSLGRLPNLRDVDQAFARDGFLSRSVIGSRFGSLMNCLSQAGIDPAYFPAELDRSRENLILLLKSLAERLGRSPTMGDVNRHQAETDHTFPNSGFFIRVFGSYSQALREAGLSENFVIKDRERLIMDLKSLGEELSHTPTSTEIAMASKAGKCASLTTYMKFFGSIPEALKAAGFEVKTEDDKRHDAIIALQMLAKSLGRTPASSDLKKARKNGFPFSGKRISAVFGSLLAFQIEAGLVPNKAQKRSHSSSEQLLEDLRIIAGELGRTPTQEDIRARSKDGQCGSASMYSAKFGSFSKALKAAGLKLSRRSESINQTDEEMLKTLGAFIASIGRDPSRNDLRRASKEKKCATPKVLTRRFGSVGEAIRRAKGEIF